jgi:rhamnogalacturonan hydrolase
MVAVFTPLLALLLLARLTLAQLIGPVGPTTPLFLKIFECNILDYGGRADNQTDVAPAITLAFEKCVKYRPFSRLVVPPGNYLMKHSIVLTNGTNWAFQLDGLITAAYLGNSTEAVANYTVPREAILGGFAGVEQLNRTINGEEDHESLQNFIVIINGQSVELLLEARALLLIKFYPSILSSMNGLGAIQGRGYLYRIAGK